MWFYIKKLINMYIGIWWTLINKVSFKLNGVKFGKQFYARGKVYVFKHQKESRIEIGNCAYINSASWANPIGYGDRVYIQMVDNGILKIGDYCGISNTAITCANHITIGDRVMIGAGCKIYDTDFHALDYDERIKGNYPGAPIKTAPIQIDDGVFIVAGVLILKGVHIGEYSVIGAGSVVTKDVPSYEIWGGNPAHFIRKLDK